MIIKNAQFTASWQAKAKGLTNLKQVSALTGVSPQTLDNWCKHKPELFEVVLCGCVVILGVDNER